jgi:glucose uptake protein GlcU
MNVKKGVIFGVVAMILVMLGLSYTLLAIESNRKVNENLQSKVSALGSGKDKG